MRKRVLSITAVTTALAMTFPGIAAATVSEVGFIEEADPAVPSCTTGPLGSFGLALEEEKKKAEEEKKKAEAEKRKTESAKRKAARKRKAEAEKKRKAASKKTSKAAKASTASRRHAQDVTPKANAAAAKRRAKAAATSTQTTTTESTTTTEGAGSETTSATPPPCLAVSKTTGFQSSVAGTHNLLVVPRNGRIVAWSLQLGKPTPSQIKFFDAEEGGPASAGIAILQPKKASKAIPKFTYKLIAQSSVLKLAPYFGLSVQFPLARTIKVRKGDVIALTVPTWAPALALGFDKRTSWRASRPQSECSVTNAQTAQTELKSMTQYGCLYQTARLTYSATLISTP